MPVSILSVGLDGLDDRDGALVERYDGREGTFYLFRPDQRIAMRCRKFDRKKLEFAVLRAMGHSP